MNPHVCLSVILVFVTYLKDTSAELEIPGKPESPKKEDVPETSNIEAPSIEAPSLSSYEMFMISDLLMEIAARPCNNVNRPVMSSIKKFLFSEISQAPNHESLHPDFFANYQSLVQCLSEADADASYHKKALASAYFPGENARGSSQPQVHSPRARREATKKESPVDNLLAKKNGFFEHELSIVDLDRSFERFFGVVMSIAETTCPSHAKPNVDFLLPALNEIVSWIAGQASVYKTAQFKYFHNTNVISELSKCEKNLQLTAGKVKDSEMDLDILE